MSYEQVDFGRHDRFDNRMLGSVGNTRTPIPDRHRLGHRDVPN